MIKQEVRLPNTLVSLITELQTEKTDFSMAIYNLVGLYLGEKLAHWEQENKRFEQKWNMSFSEFEQTRYTFPNSNSYEMDTEYMDWLDAFSVLTHYQHLQKQWTQVTLLAN